MADGLQITTARLSTALKGQVVGYVNEGQPPAGRLGELWAATGLDWARACKASAFAGRQGQVLDVVAPPGVDIDRLVILGAGTAMIEQAVAYAGTRVQFGRPIGSFQAVKHMCAEMAAALEPCRSLVWYAAHAFDHAPDESTLMACHAKSHLSEVGRFVARTSTEVHGGMGFTDLAGLHYWFKRIGLDRQLLGGPELVRNEAARVQGWIAV